jgi:nucleoside-diphosphate-sugar epimerase
VGKFRRTDTRNAVSDTSKLESLGWRPRYGTADSIREYVAWYRAEGFDKQADTDSLLALKKGIA